MPQLAGLMPYGNANDVVLDMVSSCYHETNLITRPSQEASTDKPPLLQAKEVLPVVKSTPVIAGVCASDPFRSIPAFLKQLQDLGFAGVQNFPTVRSQFHHPRIL